MNISLICNPFKRENTIYLDGKQYNSNSKINEYKNKYIYEINDEFINYIVDELNTKNLTIKFTGSRYDFETLQNLANKYNEKNESKVEFIEERIINKLDRREELKQIVSLVEESDLDEEYKAKLINPIKSSLEEEVEIAVIATVSSGKSTLINAIVGKNIMPTSTNACTASITTLRKNNIETFRLTKLNDVEKDEEVDLDKLEKLKENNEIKNLTIEGSIKGLKDLEGIKLIDTPGTNNADNEEHKKTTMNFIKSNKKPIVLFLFDKDSLQINDVDNLLRSISDEIKREDNKVDEDRFIFVVNKSDGYKKQKDLDGGINILKNRLNKIGILSPKIHFVSAYNALVSKLEENDLDFDEEEHLYALKGRIERHYNNEKFIKYHKESTLSNKIREDLDDQLEKAIENEDYKQAAYILSGVKGLEMSISEVVDKYKNINLVANAVNEVYRELKKEEVYENIQSQLSQKKEIVENLQEDINDILDVLQKSSIKEDLEKEINGIDFPQSIKDKFTKVHRDFGLARNKVKEVITEAEQEAIKLIGSENLKKPYKIEDDELQKYRNKIEGKCSLEFNERNKVCIRKSKIETSLKYLNKKVLDLKVDLDTECERYIKNEVYKKGQYIIEKYKENLSELLGDIDLLSGLNIKEYMTLSIPSVDSFIKEKTKSLKVKNQDKKAFWQFWKPNKVDEEFIELNEIIKYTQNLYEKMGNYLELTRKNIEKEKVELINRLKKVVEEIDLVMKAGLENLKNLCEHKDELEAAMSMDQDLLDVIEKYKEKINNILSI